MRRGKLRRGQSGIGSQKRAEKDPSGSWGENSVPKEKHSSGIAFTFSRATGERAPLSLSHGSSVGKTAEENDL